MARQIKILHIIKSLGRGGAEMLLPETLKIHDRQTFEFHYIYFLPWKNQMEHALRENGGHVLCMSARNNIMLMLKISAVVRYVRQHKIDLIHAHLPWAGILARVVGRVTRIPVVYTEHNKQERYHFATRLMNLRTMNWLTELIAVSADVEQSVKKHKSRLRIPVRTVLNGVNIDTFKPGGDPSLVRKTFGIPGTAIVVGTIAVFRFQKRLDTWLKIAKSIHEQRPETRFIIVGDGPLKEELFRLAKDLDLEGIVHFAGLQTEVKPFLAAMDIYMMSSIFEGMPVALLEAMASGCAIASTDAGGIKEVVSDRLHGLLCGVEEPERLTEIALTLIDNPELRTEFGRKARERVVRDFSMNKMVKSLEIIYKKLTVERG